MFGHVLCRECGENVPQSRVADHECDRDRWVSFQVAQARADIERIDTELAGYLETAQGRFALWYAERTRRRAT